jgi:hypothetical protein
VGLIKLALDLTDLLSNIIHSHLFSPRSSSTLPIAFLVMRLLGFLGTDFGGFWDLIIPGSVMAMAYRSNKGRGIAA